MNKIRNLYKQKFLVILLSTLIATSVVFPNTTAKATSGRWQQNGIKWSYINSDGSRQTGWSYIGGQWYYFSSNGDMQTGWVFTDGKWYYLNSGGDMATGWKFVGGNWYYLKANGEMVASTWINCNGKSYYLNASGDMAINITTPDGYVVGDDGAWNGQAKHSNDIIYNFNMEDRNGQNYTVNIISDDNVIAEASWKPSYDWNWVWAGAWEGERLSRGHYKIAVSKQGENNPEIYEINNNEEMTLNLDRKLIRVHKNIENGQPDFLIMGTPVCSNDSEMKVYYIKDGKLRLANFADRGETFNCVDTFNSVSLFFKQKENNIFETSCYSNDAWTLGFYISSYKFNLATDQFEYMNTRFMDTEDYFNYVRK